MLKHIVDYIKKLPVYYRVGLMFLLVIIPIYMILTFINIIGSRIIYNEIGNTMTYKVDFFASSMIKEIDKIINLQHQYSLDRDFQYLGVLSQSMDNVQRGQAAIQVSEKLNFLNLSSYLILNCGMYKCDDEWTMCSNYNIDNRNIGDIINAYLESDNTGSVFYCQDRLFIFSPYPRPFNINGQKPAYVLYTELSISLLKQELSELGGRERTGAMLIDDGGEWSIGSSFKITEQDFLRLSTKADEAGGTIFDKITQDGMTYWVSVSSFPFLKLTLISYMPEGDITRPLKLFNLIFFMFILVTIPIILLFTFSLNRVIHRPMSELVKAFKMVEEENYDIHFDKEIHGEFGYLFNSFEKMAMRIKTTIRQVYLYRISTQRAELKQLQSQINPHFLYNSFYHIYRMCRSKNYDRLEVFAQKLGGYYQYITRSEVDEVPFKREVEIARNYIDIQSIRFRDRIEVDMAEVPEGAGDIMVPKLILQPVIENVYEHGMDNVLYGGLINIRFTFDNNELNVYVEDNGEGMNDSELEALQRKLESNEIEVGRGTGIINVQHRLKMRFGDKSGITVSRSSLGGLKVHMRIVVGKD